jgi:hypothetical protein
MSFDSFFNKGKDWLTDGVLGGWSAAGDCRPVEDRPQKVASRSRRGRGGLVKRQVP